MKTFRPMVLLTVLFTTTAAAAATPLERDEHDPDVILQENAEDLGVNGWTVHAAIEIAAAANPALAGLRARAVGAQASHERGAGSAEDLQGALEALRAREREVVGEIEGLLTPAQREGLRRLMLEARS